MTVIFPAAHAEKKVSIVVVNYNAGDLLRRCVESSLPQATELIVVDNASADGSLDKLLVEFAGVAKLQIIRNAKNLGFAAACNLGANVSKGDFVLFLNPDCIAAEGAVQRLAYALQGGGGTVQAMEEHGATVRRPGY
jgi:GT2 family glycosyltransferase